MMIKKKFHSTLRRLWDTGSTTWRKTSPTSSRSRMITNKSMNKKRYRCRTSRTTITTTTRRRRLRTHKTIIMNQWTWRKFRCSCTTPTTIPRCVKNANSYQDQNIPVNKINKDFHEMTITIKNKMRHLSSLLSQDKFVRTSR